jgi:Mg/Co/Ni transporter MgtE
MAIVFMKTHPQDAAKTLSQISSADAATFLVEAPVEVSAVVLASMPPISAARCLESCENPTAAARLIEGIAPLVAKNILAHLPLYKKAVLQRLSKNKATAIRKLLDHPENTVGAWVDNQVFALAETDTVSEALISLGTLGVRYGGTVYVLGAHRRLLGEVAVSRLLTGPKNAQLSRLATSCSRILSSFSSLASVVDLAEWETQDVLPVVDRDQRFLGVIHHTALTKRTSGDPILSPGYGLSWLIANIADVYWKGAAAIITTLIPGPTEEGNLPDQGSRREN